MTDIAQTKTPAEIAAGLSEIWPKCKHPKTSENSQAIGLGRFACRTCRRAIANRYAKKRTKKFKRAQDEWEKLKEELLK